MTVASACARVVLPTPGKSSISKWPRANKQLNASFTCCSLPMMMLFTLSTACCRRCLLLLAGADCWKEISVIFQSPDIVFPYIVFIEFALPVLHFKFPFISIPIRGITFSIAFKARKIADFIEISVCCSRKVHCKHCPVLMELSADSWKYSFLIRVTLTIRSIK